VLPSWGWLPTPYSCGLVLPGWDGYTKTTFGAEGQVAQEREIAVTVNGQRYAATVEVRLSLVDFLRDTCGLTGTHVGCEHGVCGACTVLLDGAGVRSCLLLAVQVDDAEVLTVEGLAAPSSPAGRAAAGARAAGEGLHPLQQAFWEHHGLQCGYCTPGMLITALELLREEPDPDEATIREALSGNLCICTGYVNVVRAVQAAAVAMRGEA
jgi:aerobic carbon-monoxide dehydrogenase small subunit